MTLMNEEELARQRLFEKWVKKKSWSIHDAACLFLSIDPESEVSGPELERLQQGMQLAIDGDDLKIINSTSIGDHVLEPLVVFQWARRTGVSLPPALVALMEFIMKITMSSGSEPIPTFETPVKGGTKDVENVLGGCLAVVTNFPEECKGRGGKMKVELILKMLTKHAEILFDDGYPVLSSTAIRDIVTNWVQKLS